MKKYFTHMVIALLTVTVLTRCGGASNGSDGTASQIVAGSVGGASNDNLNGGSSSYAFQVPKEKPSLWSRIRNAFDLLPDALAFQVSCSGGAMSPSSFASGTTFQWTPISCSLSYRNGRQASVQWSSYFDINYSSACTGSDFQFSTQPDGCVITRTTPQSGNIRTLTRPNGDSHAVTIDTNSPSGWDSSIVVNGNGTAVTAQAASFASRQIVINGTHLTSVLNGKTTNWDHTVSTDPASPLVFSGVGASKTLESGTVIVQHNLAKYDSVSVISSPVVFGNPNCCFPTSGSIETSFKGGQYDGKSETIEFSSDCGEVTLVNSAGVSSSITLAECL